MLAFVSSSSRQALRSTHHIPRSYHSLLCGSGRPTPILRVTSVFSSRLFQVPLCTMAGQSGSGTTFKYFSYGSNLLRERILINNPSAQFYGVATLHGYKLTFDAAASVPVSEWLDDNWCGAAATIRPSAATDRVCGVVWDVDLAQMEFLDKQECLYTPLEVDVIGERGETLTCRTYEMERKTHGIHLPSPHYKQVIVTGAKQNGLPPDYIRFLESIPDNGVTTTPPIYAKVVEMVKKFREENGKEFIDPGPCWLCHFPAFSADFWSTAEEERVNNGVLRTAEPFCLAGDPPVDLIIEALCKTNGYTQTVLFGRAADPGFLKPLTCFPGSFPRCPRGSTCVPDSFGAGTCCFGRLQCGESLDQLFQSSLEYNGRTYLLSRFPSYNSEIAQATCLAQGGYLAELDDYPENRAVKEFVATVDLGDNIGVLISGTDVVNEGTFVFQYSGKKMTYFNFAPSQPDNRADAACLQLFADENFKWDDIPCDRDDILYLCEIPSPP